MRKIVLGALVLVASATSIGCARNAHVSRINDRVSQLEQRVMVLEARTGGAVVAPNTGGYYNPAFRQ